jgi:tetratricopeptide (TPR) repeat protein
MRGPFFQLITLIKVSVIVSMVGAAMEANLHGDTIHPRSSDSAVSYHLGREQLLGGDAKAAIRHFRAALESRAWRGSAQVGIGDSLAQLGLTADALEEYGRAPASIRGGPDVALRIAACKLGVGRATEAKRILQRLLRRDKGNRYAAALLARCHSVLHHYEKARRLALSILSEEPGQSEALKAACMALSAIGDIQGTVKHSRRLLEVEP